MTHRWEFEDEYIQLCLGLNRALREGDQALYTQLLSRKQALDDIQWQTTIAVFTELAPFHSVAEALHHTAVHMHLPFPTLSNPTYNTGDGKFIFGISDGQRTVQVWPMEDRGYYSIEVFEYESTEHGTCYRGATSSLEAATLALVRWFVERCSIDSLHAALPWISAQPFHPLKSRMSFE